ncbi:unnamed protein product [Ectocarpus sp. 6 AP-2014]
MVERAKCCSRPTVLRRYRVISCLAIPAFGGALTTSPNQGLDVAVVGGGIAGLASAVSLRAIGGVRKVRVFERGEGFGEYGGFGLALWPNGLRALRHMDTSLHDEVVRSGSVIGERMFTTAESTSIDYCREREAFGHPMLCLRLLSLHNALRRTALRLGCDILSGMSCEKVYPSLGEDGKKRAALLMAVGQGLEEEEEEEEVVLADFVIGADGLNSVVRARLGDDSKPRDTHCVWFFGIVGHAACPILLRSRVHTFFLSDPTKAASLMPCGDDNTYWAVALTGDNIKEAMALRGDDQEMKRFLKAQFGECNALVKLIEATPPHQVHRRRIEDRPATKSFVSGAGPDEFYSALVGDAAHPTRPSLGQGANMALEDAVQLALVLRETTSIEDALRQYDSARVLRCAKLQGDSDFVAEQALKLGEDDWPAHGGDGQASRNRPANKGMGDAEFVYNWEPLKLHHFPWQPK